MDTLELSARLGVMRGLDKDCLAYLIYISSFVVKETTDSCSTEAFEAIK